MNSMLLSQGIHLFFCLTLPRYKVQIYRALHNAWQLQLLYKPMADHEPISASEVLSVATALGSCGVILLESSKRDIYRKNRFTYNVIVNDYFESAPIKKKLIIL